MNSTFEKPMKGAEPIPGYCLGDLLGAGGFGEVWMAYAPGGFQVALKFVRLSSPFDAAERRALEVIRTIRHPNLLTTFASWEIDRWLIIGMELADMTLRDRFRQAVETGHTGIPRDELLEYWQEAARGIDFLNDPKKDPNGKARTAIQHRDIKPQNILLVGNGVKVADFGLARVMHHAETSHSGACTIAYAAPEFFQKHTTHTSDQYSFGVTYYQMRTGRLPFEGSIHEIIQGHVGIEPDLSALPAAERVIVARAMAKDPKERWPSCRAFVDALMACDNVPLPTGSSAADRTKTSDPGDIYATRDAESPRNTVSTVEFPRPKPAPKPPKAPAPPVPKTDDWVAPQEAAIRTLKQPPRQVVGKTPAAPPPLPRKAAVLSGGLRSWTIGRGSKCDLIVSDDAVSSAHCQLTETIDGFFLEDLSSANGTFVNGRRISAATAVSPNDSITLGHATPMPWPERSHTTGTVKILTIGRDPDNHIVLDHSKVSGRHARLLIGRGEARIEDLGSTNGIAINQPNNKVPSAVVRPDDTVYFGTYAVPAARLLGESTTAIKEPRKIKFTGQPIVFGRDADCDCVVDLPKASGRHARLWLAGDVLMIEDLGSTNGTLLNGRRVQSPVEAKPGDQIGIGGESITIVG